MKEYISVGKNVDLAIEEGLRVLGLNREDVDIKILETGGLFKKAKVCLMYEQPEIPEVKEEQVEEIEVKTEQVVESTEVEQPVEQTLVVEDKVDTAEQHIEEVKHEEKIEKEVKNAVSPDELKARVENFLIDLAKKVNIDVNVECTITDNDLNFNVTGENVGKLIGYRGETLSAIQTLLGGLKRAGEGRYRLYLDIENYKKAREQTIIDLANKMADKAEEIERNVHLDPMNPYERRIVHSALQGRELVETESMGEGEKRHVVIKFKR